MRVSNAPLLNSKAGGASHIVTSRLSPTPTVVPIGCASPMTSAKPGIGSDLDRRSATTGVRGMTFIPSICWFVPALRIAPRVGPTAVDKPVAAQPPSDSKTRADNAMRRGNRDWSSIEAKE